MVYESLDMQDRPASIKYKIDFVVLFKIRISSLRVNAPSWRLHILFWIKMKKIVQVCLEL